MRLYLRFEDFPGRVSTVLVARSLSYRFTRKIEKHGGLNRYLEFLLSRYRKVIFLRKPRRDRTEYQSQGLELQAFKFRPSNLTWLRLGILARHCGVSRCWIVVFLFLKDIEHDPGRVVATQLTIRYKRIEYIECLDPVEFTLTRMIREKPA